MQAWLAIIIIIAVPGKVLADSCSEQARQHPVFQAFDACEKASAARAPEDIRRNLAKLEQTGYCALLAEPGKPAPDLLNSVCADPNGFACIRKRGFLLNSKCEFVHLEPEDIAHTPGYLGIRCAYETAAKQVIDKHRDECDKGDTPDDCEASLKLDYRHQINKIERNLAYTPERIDRLQRAFNRVKHKYLEKIQNTRLIAPDQRTMILSRIAKTKLDLPPTLTECANAGPTGPESGLYYGRTDQMIHFCIGAMATLDHQNELDLIHSFGHELSHAIDPCTLEAAFPKSSEIGLNTYPGLVQCLRGGSGADGCVNSILTCNTRKGVQEACEEEAATRDDANREFMAKCMKRMSHYNACPISKTDKQAFSFNLAEYRKDGESISQIQEAFSDYMGSEVVADLITEDTRDGIMTRQDRIDGITALAADYAGLHGRCITENTKDVHPAPFLRMNRIIMGSTNFRKALGCENGPPKTPGANMSCKGL